MEVEKQQNNLGVPIAIVLAGLIIAMAIIYTGGKTKNQQAAVAKSAENKEVQEVNILPVSDKDHIRGNLNASIKIVEFSDTECPFCKVFHQTMKEIISSYNNGKDQVAWIYRHFPLDSLHSKARKEAEATECAVELGGDEAFWEYIDRLFEITPSNDGLDLALLPKIASDIGLDKVAFEKCLASGKYADKIEASYQDATSAGGSGTPYSVLIDSKGQKYPINGAVPIQNLKSIIDTIINNSQK